MSASKLEAQTLVLHDALPPWKPHDSSRVRAGEGRVRWSGAGDPPAIGATVHVRINDIGRAKVVSYFTEHGFLGLYVRPANPPEWYVRQNGRRACCHVFGAELGER